jgi:hypothetical protein
MNITVLSLQDFGLSKATATRMFQMWARYIDPHHVQVHRPIVLKNKATTTTMTLRAMKLDSIIKLAEYRIINIGRSNINNWIDTLSLTTAIKNKG